MLNKLMIGRLGNQMFQYATMRAFQEKNNINEKINLDFSYVRKSGNEKDGFFNQLEIFKLNDEKYIIDNKIKISLTQKILVAMYFLSYKIIKVLSNSKNYENNKKKFENRIQHFYNKKGLYLYNYGYYEFEKSNKKNKLFIGYYESPKYFEFIKKQLKEEFTPKEEKLEKNLELYRIIENSESVCVSIRRGDFLDKKNKEYCYICNPQYFQRAIKEMKKRLKNPRFIIFSDDIDWVKKNIEFPPETKYEDGNDPVWEKLRLMYSCKHFILSNSTFSWWAQYLSANQEKIVIAPKKWRNFGYDSKDIYMKDWILIDMDN